MPPTHSQVAYQNLRNRLIAGEFPPGSRILYGPIGQELGISATPVREAIGRLAHEGLVELVPQLGAVVRCLDRSELIELYEMREAIEPYAAAKAAQRATATQRAAIQRTVEKMQKLADKVDRSKSRRATARQTVEFEKADLSFHMLIIEATGNRLMIRSSESSNALTRVFATQRHPYTAAIMQDTCDDHSQICDAIVGQHSDRAAVAMRNHIASGLAVTLESIDLSRIQSWETC